MLTIGWILLAAEAVVSIFFVAVFWHFWSHSAIKRSVAIVAIVVYALGCLLTLSLTLFLPL